MINTLLYKINNLPVIDTHEHFTAEQYMNSSIDFFDLLVPYICDNLLTAGMVMDEYAQMMNKTVPFEIRTELFLKYYPLIRTTTYFKSLDRTLKSDFKLKDYNSEELRAVSDRLSSSQTSDCYKQYMEKEKVEAILTCMPYDIQTAFNNSVLHYIPTLSDLCLRSRADTDKLSKASGVEIQNLDSVKLAIDKLFLQYAKAEVKAIKFGSAYRRHLDYAAVTRHEAESVLLDVMKAPVMGDSKMCGIPSAVLSADAVKPLDDYLTDYMVTKAGEIGIPVIFHIGLHAWNENDVDACHASHLEPLIRRHRNTKFLLLHSGVPFFDEAIILCKYFSNVFLNLTWCHIIDRTATITAIKRMTELLPANKIHAFGGDYIYPQQVSGHLNIAKENIATAFSEMIDAGQLTPDEAEVLAQMWFYDNPKAFFKL